MSRGHRLVAPALVGATGVLGLVLVASSMVLGSTPAHVAGVAVPQPTITSAPSVPYQGGSAAGGGQLGSPGTVPPAPPPTVGKGGGGAVKPAPKPAPGQKPGTVRLARGGTATLIRKEVGKDAILPVPENLNEATWWGAGLDAGSGATVVAGHVNWKGSNGPFAELWDARAGDVVSVVDTTGRAWRYKVSRLVTVGKDELPRLADALFGQDGPHRLVLVTCGGRWVGGDTGYASNQIVVADPIA